MIEERDRAKRLPKWDKRKEREIETKRETNSKSEGRWPKPTSEESQRNEWSKRESHNNTQC